MKQPGGTTFLIFGLAFLALAQAFLLLRGQAEKGSDYQTWLKVGDTLAGVIAAGPENQRHSLATGGATILLVFSSDCVHCQEVSPFWREWTHAAGSKPRTLALTTEPLETARAYVTEQGWDAEVWSVAVERSGGIERALMSRTPWVFLLSRDGVILAEGHGKNITEIAGVEATDDVVTRTSGGSTGGSEP